MEFGEIVGALLLVGFYLLSAMAGKKKRQQRSQLPPRRPEQPRPRPAMSAEARQPQAQQTARVQRPNRLPDRPEPQGRDPIPRSVPDRSESSRSVSIILPSAAPEEPSPPVRMSQELERRHLLERAEAYLQQVAGQHVGAGEVGTDADRERSSATGPHVDTRNPRQGIIWQAILGKPKGLE